MISMTWPEYQRRQCRIGAFVVQLTPLETELLSALLVGYPHSVTIEALIESAYPDPDSEPDDAEATIIEGIRKLARKIGAFRIMGNARYRAYSLRNRPEDISIAA
jgi:DNA-binding response OmpR family regulator